MNKTREERLRKARIENVVNAIFFCESGLEVYEAIETLSPGVIESIRKMCEEIMTKNLATKAR